ncbi:MAG: hypothetical protein ABIK07_24920 [Planctomycetota bacterium]
MVFGILAIILGGYIALMNWSAPIQSQRQNRNVSMVPFFGGILLGVGIYSLTGSILWALIAIPCDPETGLFLLALPWLFNELWQTSRFNELATFYNNDQGREIFIRLYRNRRATITQKYNDTDRPQDSGVMLCQQGLVGKWERINDVFCLSEFAGGRKLELACNGENFQSTESNVEADEEQSTLMNDLNFQLTKNRFAKTK